MRDRNQLNLEQLNIQFDRVISRKLENDLFPRKPVSDSPNLLDPDLVRIVYPKSFRLLRTLSIIHYWFPEFLFWRVHLDLEEMSFNHLNFKQQVELSLLLLSKEKMINFYLKTKKYTGSEIFGNFLGNDLKELFSKFKVIRINYKLIKGVYRRGYRDKGFRRPDHLWLPKNDYTFNEYQVELEKASDHLNKLINRLSKLLE